MSAFFASRFLGWLSNPNADSQPATMVDAVRSALSGFPNSSSSPSELERSVECHKFRPRVPHRSLGGRISLTAVEPHPSAQTNSQPVPRPLRRCSGSSNTPPCPAATRRLHRAARRLARRAARCRCRTRAPPSAATRTTSETRIKNGYEHTRALARTRGQQNGRADR